MENNSSQESNSKILKLDIKFTYALKTLKNNGNLVYEYNPFRNYRLSETMFEYNKGIYSYKELVAKFGITLNNLSENATNIEILDVINGKDKIEWRKKNNLLNISESPILRRKGELVDFETSELNFDIHNPVNILPLYSYDNSVNLIINDGKNQPRLINSRFSATERNKYLIVDRKGDNDTNIYDLGTQFDIDTSLHKKTITIPEVKYFGTYSAGNLGIGNYHFYFKYLDADGNESDFIAESGLISIFIGNNPLNIYTGTRNENSHKGISILLKNLDPGYLYISVYYTKSTADVYENASVSAFKIEQRFLINTTNMCQLRITGFEEVTEIPIEDINLQFQLFDNVKTQCECLNRLFVGNVTTQNLNYKELADISLRFCPYYCTEPYIVNLKISEDYDPRSDFNNSYYNSEFIYNKVGYWPSEIYRFGIVYILNDGSLTPVFNTRGIKTLPKYDSPDIDYTLIPYYDTDSNTNLDLKIRKYVSYNEETNALIVDLALLVELENTKGVVSFPQTSTTDIYSIKFKLYVKDNNEKNDVLQDLKNKYGVRGYFFVRQKRLPTTLCQALTIGVDKESHTPVIPVGGKYIAECFLTPGLILSNTYENHKYTIRDNSTINFGAICPDYDVDYPYYNSIFSGDSFVTSRLAELNLTASSLNPRHYYNNENIKDLELDLFFNEIVKIQAIEDSVPLVAIGETMFSSKAGNEMEVFRFEYLGYEDKTTKASNLVRGAFGPYLGLDGCHSKSCLLNIFIPNYNFANFPEYFLIRYNDKSSFFAIGERIDITSFNEDKQYYRGDCYICQFTHRVNRNFQDSSAPTADTIVNSKCWKDNWEMKDGLINMEKIDKINIGDINAVQLGQWITFTVRSSKNLSIRTLDSSNVDEEALVGHSRGFYPYLPLSTKGIYKIPEALCYNKGFEKSVSERYNFEVPDVPALKNDFTNRISYSDIQITDAFKNNFRTFRGTNYRDYPKTYGSITKLVELRGNLLCIFEHGIGLIPVNERAVAGEGSGGNIYINTSNVLPENPRIISDTFGSLWPDSIIKTSKGIYGVDTIGKKIWRTNGETFECISDFRILEFLNNNISLTERELEPIIGIRNVKTHYNKFKEDVMFTFYDNLYGFEERVWNICWNENLLKWVTFYSWVPSYSENIYNQYFSFDRNTSKWITKLGISNHENDFSDGITLSNNIIDKKSWAAKLYLNNRNIPREEGIVHSVKYELCRDNLGNYKLFNDPIETNEVDPETGLKIWQISLKEGVTYELLCSEFYARVYEDCYLDDLSIKNGVEVMTAPLIANPNSRKKLPKGLYSIWRETLGNLKVYKNDRGRRINLSSRDKDRRVNGNSPVILLNIKATLRASSDKSNEIPLAEAYVASYNDSVSVDSGYYQSTVAIIPEYNILFLTTDFWKHGLAGIIDIADKVYPTYWYGKQHPFEFEFVVVDNPDSHKIFDNLEIISNKAAPESFHYEIVGECYDFAKDKKNMYIRQEATKELYQYNGSDIVFNHDYKDLVSEHRPLTPGDSNPKYYDKSTIFPLYYGRLDTINEIEDFYHLHGHKDSYGKGDKNFSALAGAEIVRYENLDEYRIWNHAKAVDIAKDGLLRGNMYYKEDKWDVQINPINLVQRNESKEDWLGNYGATVPMVPAEYNLFPVPDAINENGLKHGITLPEDWTRNVVSWPDYLKINKEVKLKDKFIKIRIRYSGEDLAIISAIRTLYSLSYS